MKRGYTNNVQSWFKLSCNELLVAGGRISDNLAMIYQTSGRNDKAEAFMQRSEAIKSARQ